MDSGDNMVGEDDKLLLNSLGVTSANPEDIERNILDTVRCDENTVQHTNEAFRNDQKNINLSTSSKKELHNKLKALEIEIDAVASSVEHTGNVAKIKESTCEKDGIKEDAKEMKGIPNQDFSLQHALAADRLRSLKRTRSQLQKQLSDLNEDCISSGVGDDRLLADLVKDESKAKTKSDTGQESLKKQKKKRKIVSYGEDDGFDDLLNAASGGLIETEKDELIRKGILTPFHKLKGYERRIEHTGLLRVTLEEETNHVSASVERAARSLAEAAQARPTTKLLDSDELPKLDAPTFPFQRLRTPFKPQRKPDIKEEKDKGSKRKKRRPLAGKKWRKSSNEEINGIGECVPGDSVTSGCEEEDNEKNVQIENDEELPYVTLEGGLKIPEAIFSGFFDYQKVGVQWLWELHCQGVGGIIGDEMGLGKTVQVLGFLGSLHFSNLYKPSIVICPVTLLRQWKREAEKWYPAFHVEILHDSAVDTVARRKKRADSDESDSGENNEGSVDSDYEKGSSSKSSRRWELLIKRVLGSESGLLLTTYEQLRILGRTILDIKWGYAVLDEGHRIRNPNADITILGVLPIFEAEFAAPIAVGGYANASPLQVSTAYRCAVVLRDLIMPYLLRRMKADVDAQLTKKTEHVLFCSLTPEQRSVYRAFLASSEVEQIFDGRKNSLYGIDVMRKICNHPDLLEREHSLSNPDYGNPERSGKMKVIDQVLKKWKEQGHRVLLFAQTQQMLDILENFMIANGYNYRRMDGSTAVKQRSALMDEFNDSSDVFIFILTTKVGGLGTNLIGADRVIIFDPDWNPSTDMQARERAWRIGQKRDVTIYRLITRGTIEEKILKNPQQKRFFKARDLKDLFILNDDGDPNSTETSNLFGGISTDLNVVGSGKDNQLNPNSPSTSLPHLNTREDNEENNTLQESCSHQEREGDGESGRQADDEANFLKSLFDAHGIHSAVNHDAIMNAHDEDKIRVEEQANQIAQRAAEALRQSRMLRRREDISIPTWTGKSGAAGAPYTVHRKFGSTVNSQLVSNTNQPSPSRTVNGPLAGSSGGRALSSTELLARICGDRANAVADGLEHQLVSASSRLPKPSEAGSSKNATRAQPEMLIRQICTYIQQRGGSTDSACIADHFKPRILSEDLPLFKNLLKEIAILERGADGLFWVLKPEYRD
ncbi:hypothetical protein V2J09_015657 [Rumex salicifolius]